MECFVKHLAAAIVGLLLFTGCSNAQVIQVIFGDHGDEAVEVAECESGLDNNIVSPGGGNHGLFQINNVHQRTWVNGDPDTNWRGVPWELRYDPVLNASFAKQVLFDFQGWRPWTCNP